MSKIDKKSKVSEKIEKHEIYISTFKSVTDKKPRVEKVYPWDEWSAAICNTRNRAITPKKTSVPLFTCARFKGKRGSANVDFVTAIALDFDDGTPFTDLPPGAMTTEFVAYSTHSHTPETHKFRVVVPLSRPVTAAEYTALWPIVNNLFGGTADQNAKDPGRMSYFPSCPPENKKYAFSRYNKGKLLDPDILLSKGAVAEDTVSAGERPDMMQGYPDNYRTYELLRRAGWCLSVDGMTEDETIEACHEWNTHNTPPLEDEKIIETVKSIVKNNNAKLLSAPWGELTPLITKLHAVPYPIDSLPEKIRDAVKEVQGFVKAPMAMVASSALATLSIAGQAYADVQRSEKLHGPIGLYLLTIAESGERKTTCDQFFMSAIRKHEKEQREKGVEKKAAYQAIKKVWDTKESTLHGKIKIAVEKNGNTENLAAELETLQLAEPPAPKTPRFIFTDTTPEALVYSLAKNWPAGGIISSEAGIVFGGHGMKSENIMRNLSTLNILWDGTPYQSDRKSSESFTLHNARLTIALQIQEPMLREFFDHTSGLPRGGGFMARFLIANPESTQGMRSFSEPPSSWPALAVFHDRIEKILARPIKLIGHSLWPVMLHLSSEAKKLWIQFHDEIELKLCAGGQLHDVRDVASKTTDNAVRLAALFHLFGGNGEEGKISHANMQAACAIVSWHLYEAQRFFGEIALPEELANAGRLERWLADYCRKMGVITVAQRHAQQFGPVRKKEPLKEALHVLEDLGHVRLITQGKRKDIYLHPELLKPPT